VCELGPKACKLGLNFKKAKFFTFSVLPLTVKIFSSFFKRSKNRVEIELHQGRPDA
jgi:hypothetical protein